MKGLCINCKHYSHRPDLNSCYPHLCKVGPDQVSGIDGTKTKPEFEFCHMKNKTPGACDKHEEVTS